MSTTQKISSVGFVLRWAASQVILLALVVRSEWVELPRLRPSETKRTDEATPKERTRATTELFVSQTEEPFQAQEPEGIKDPELQATLLQVHSTLVREANKPIGAKIQFLKKLQNRLLRRIKKNSEFLWSGLEEGRGQGHMMSFPSLEGALMTISFLTFAVFLIKIVKQFIQGLQGVNAINMVGIDIPATVVTPAKVVRHKRENIQATAKILQYIEDFKLHHKLDGLDSVG